MRLTPERILVHGSSTTATVPAVVPVLASDTPLSFWGGLDPTSGLVLDARHPLAGTSVAGTILCLPSGRGSCTASQVLLELILNGVAPAAIVLRDLDPLVAAGAVVAQQVLLDGQQQQQQPLLLGVPTIVQVGNERYQALLEYCTTKNIGLDDSSSSFLGVVYGTVLSNGTVCLGETAEMVQDQVLLQEAETSSTTGNSAFEGDTTVDSLTAYEETRLSQCTTGAERMALQVIFKYARVCSDNPTYATVSKAHIVSVDGRLQRQERIESLGCIYWELISLSQTHDFIGTGRMYLHRPGRFEVC
jgi:predicted aconitase with swiveling domain